MSSTRQSVRRSRRAPKRISDYNVGDVVEIDHSGTTLKARLAQLLTESSSPNPRWLIKFDGQPYKDEEVYEHTFGKLLVAAEDEPDSAENGESAPVAQSKRNGGGKQKSPKNSADEAEGQEAAGEKGDNDKKVSFSGESSPMGSDDGGSSTHDSGEAGGKVSAREARSLRRQAMIDDTPGNASGGNNKRRQPTGAAAKRSNKRSRDGENKEVVKVKLLTGTLYLYRGLNRRAEFIRRV